MTQDKKIQDNSFLNIPDSQSVVDSQPLEITPDSEIDTETITQEEKQQQLKKEKNKKNRITKKLRNKYQIYNSELADVLAFERNYDASEANLENQKLNLKLGNIKSSDIQPSSNFSKAA